MVEKGEAWERPAAGPAEWHVSGDDATLAAAVRDRPGARLEFRPGPGSDLARAVGAVHHEGDGRAPATVEIDVDALRVVADGRELFGVNMVVVGVAPDRASWFTAAPGLRVRVGERVVHDGPATTVVVANGQYLRGADLVPARAPGRRPGRGPGVRAAAGRAGRDAVAAAPGRPPAASRHHPDERAPGRDPGRQGPAPGRGRRGDARRPHSSSPSRSCRRRSCWSSSGSGPPPRG